MDQNKSFIHSHITNLGINAPGKIIQKERSLVGQTKAREAFSLILDLTTTKSSSGLLFILTGESGTGKSALLHAFKNEVKVPVIHISASEIQSTSINQIELLQKYLRSAINLQIKEIKDVYEGEVTEYSINDDKTEFFISLKTLKGSKRLRISASLYNLVEKENISVGDIVYIESNSGIIKRLGRSEAYIQDIDIESERYVSIPKTDVWRRREIIQEITLNDLDLANAKPNSGAIGQILNSYNFSLKGINDDLRRKVDLLVSEYIENDICSMNRGVVIIEDCNLLNEEVCRFLESYADFYFSPIIILSCNMINENNDCFYKTFEKKAMITLNAYNQVEIEKIVEMRIKHENLIFNEQSLKKLNEMALEKGLQYAFKILSFLKNLSNEINEELLNSAQNAIIH